MSGVDDEEIFLRARGTLSGRIVPEGWVPTPEGTRAFCLGSDQPGWTGRFRGGDFVKVAQSAHLGTDARLFRSRARLRGPAVAPPDGWAWEFVGIIGQESVTPSASHEAYLFEVQAGRTRDLTDLAMSRVGSLSSVDVEVGFLLRVRAPFGADPVELEIPAVYLDAHALDAATAELLIANRSPEPGGTRVPRDEPIQFDLIDTSGIDVPDLSTVQVFVEGVLAYDGSAGGQQPGYVVTTTFHEPNVLRIKVRAPYLFDSLATIDVRAVGESSTGAHQVDGSWSFSIADESAPRVVGADSIAHSTVRITFDEEVTDSALVPGAYSFGRLEAPGVDVVATSVARVSPSVVDVALDLPITRGILYRVIASGVEDLFGNEVTAPYDRADFRGFECDQPEGRDFDIWTTMISQINRDLDATRDLYKFVACLQEVVDLLLCDVDRWTDILDVDLAAERYLDQMLVGLGNPFAFAAELDPDGKRRLVRILTSIYQLKGTARGIVASVRFFLGIELEVVTFLGDPDTWLMGLDELGVGTYLGPGTSRARFSFELISPVVLDDDQEDKIRAIVELMKPGHTHLVRIVEPTPPETVDHWEVGLSQLSTETELH